MILVFIAPLQFYRFEELMASCTEAVLVAFSGPILSFKVIKVFFFNTLVTLLSSEGPNIISVQAVVQWWYLHTEAVGLGYCAYIATDGTQSVTLHLQSHLILTLGYFSSLFWISDLPHVLA